MDSRCGKIGPRARDDVKDPVCIRKYGHEGYCSVRKEMKNK